MLFTVNDASLQHSLSRITRKRVEPIRSGEQEYSTRKSVLLDCVMALSLAQRIGTRIEWIEADWSSLHQHFQRQRKRKSKKDLSIRRDMPGDRRIHLTFAVGSLYCKGARPVFHCDCHDSSRFTRRNLYDHQLILVLLSALFLPERRAFKMCLHLLNVPLHSHRTTAKPIIGTYCANEHCAQHRASIINYADLNRPRRAVSSR